MQGRTACVIMRSHWPEAAVIKPPQNMLQQQHIWLPTAVHRQAHTGARISFNTRHATTRRIQHEQQQQSQLAALAPCSPAEQLNRLL